MSFKIRCDRDTAINILTFASWLKLMKWCLIFVVSFFAIMIGTSFLVPDLLYIWLGSGLKIGSILSSHFSTWWLTFFAVLLIEGIITVVYVGLFTLLNKFCYLLSRLLNLFISFVGCYGFVPMFALEFVKIFNSKADKIRVFTSPTANTIGFIILSIVLTYASWWVRITAFNYIYSHYFDKNNEYEYERVSLWKTCKELYEKTRYGIMWMIDVVNKNKNKTYTETEVSVVDQESKNTSEV